MSLDGECFLRFGEYEELAAMPFLELGEIDLLVLNCFLTPISLLLCFLLGAMKLKLLPW